MFTAVPEPRTLWGSALCFSSEAVPKRQGKQFTRSNATSASAVVTPSKNGSPSAVDVRRQCADRVAGSHDRCLKSCSRTCGLARGHNANSASQTSLVLPNV
ncbi:hypothetical protein MRX96_058633 [Rhipicephalus microplus]